MTDIGAARPAPQDPTGPRPTRHEPFPRPRHATPPPPPGNGSVPSARDGSTPHARHDGPPRPTRHEAPPSTTRYENPARHTRHEAAPDARRGAAGATRHEAAGPGATRHEAAGPGATRYEPGGPGATRQQSPGPSGPVAPTIPPELAERLTDVVPWQRSGQSELLRAVDRATGERVFVKVYFEHVTPDTALLGLLERADRDRVVPVLAHGTFTDPIYHRARCWEMQPYVPGGTLTDLLARTAERARPGLALRVCDELTAALHYCHDDLGHAHRDLKPDNVLVAGDDPVRLVLADFGSSRSSSVSRQFSAIQMTELYAAPEALNGHLGTAQDWWALGMVLLETLLGRHPYAGLDSMTVRDRLTSYDVDVTGVDDGEWRLLLEGLLTRSREHRWGAGEVVRWRRGERPEVHRVAERQHPPIDVDGHPIESPRHLAAFFLGDHERAQDWLTREHERLADWLAEDVGDTGWSVRPLRRPIGEPAEARRLMASFAAHFGPELPPRYRGHAVDVTGLRVLAQNAQNGRSTADGERFAEIMGRRLLGVFARHRCTAGHMPGCGEEGCRVLGGLATDPNVPLIRENANEMLATWARRSGLSGRLGAVSGASRDEVADRAEALVLGYLLDLDRARADAATVRSAGPQRPDWWTELRDDALAGRGPQRGAVALALAVVTSDDADREQAAHDQEAAERAAETARVQRERRDRERTERAAAAAVRRRESLRRLSRPLTRWSTPALAGTVFLALLEVLRLLDPSALRSLYELALYDPSSFYREFFVYWYFEANRWIYDQPLGDLTGPLTKRAEPWAQYLVLVLGAAAAVALVRRSRVRRTPTTAAVGSFAAVAVCAVALCYLLLPEALGVLAAFTMGAGGVLCALLLLAVFVWIMVTGS